MKSSDSEATRKAVRMGTGSKPSLPLPGYRVQGLGWVLPAPGKSLY